ncbi:RNA methyltransferase [Salmonella enterica subsp. diarizonae]|nr:RNA methyltransferase [Salmonella enterica subsp. diarizonae]
MTRVAAVPVNGLRSRLTSNFPPKTADLHRLLTGLPVEQWCAPIGGPEQGFRNKAKMVVSGSVEKTAIRDAASRRYAG